MSVAALVPKVRKAVGVSSSYDDEDIPDLIRRCIKRLLRDYHFPKSVVKVEYDSLTLGQQEFELPAGFKKELRVQFYDGTGTTPTWSDPLQKRDGFVLPQSRGYARYYWLVGNNLVIDTPLKDGWEDTTLQLWAESVDVTTHEGWFTEDFEDLLFIFASLRGAVEYQKSEQAQLYGALWEEDKTSLAVYANELEFGNLNMQLNEPRERPIERYPIR